ncbi:MAG TPA: SUMF1/EgtB/PvdO family nonheme iron enzyme [Rhabdochlamydiaceae bacterium]|nr:SUMF1/EgtB/PvdO family nonheme iron enzyme [Rhabdochlamydiaceae bacterium]
MIQDQLQVTSLGDYTILAKLSDSFLGGHRFLKKKHWLKLLPKEECSNQQWMEQFEKKVAEISQLEHPNIVKVHHIASSDDQHFLVLDAPLNASNEMEDLNDYLSANLENLKEEQLFLFCKQIAGALDSAHEQNASHLGLNLNEIFIGSEGQLLIADFGLAPFFYSTYAFPTHSLMQRFAFLAPEQKSGLGDYKSDIFAFGVLAYYLMMRKFPEGVFIYPSEQRKDFRLNWDFIISSCLQQDPNKRPAKLLDLLENLDGVKPVSDSKKPVLKPQELARPEYEPDPASIFQIDNVVAKYTPKQQEIKAVEPLLTEMIVIEGGTFFRGSNHGGRDEMPRHAINLSSFALDIHQVTNEQFVRFLEALGGEKDVNNNDIIRLRESRIKKTAGKLCIESGYAKHPVIGVTWYGAIAYSKWVGKRLPTEAEWEIAACGGLDSAQYPTGDNIERSHANFFSSDTTVVMSYPPNNYGLYDMAGNVYEWCHDWYSYNYYDISIQEPDDPKGPLQGVYRVLRGGCWKSLKEDMRCAHRHRNNPGSMNRTCGFRCAADVSES